MVLLVMTGTTRAQSFSPPTSYSTGDNPLFAAVGDFNGDGKLDMAVTNTLSNTVSVLLNNGDGTFQNPVPYPTQSSPEPIVSADFNGDGKLDLAIGNVFGGNLGTGSVGVMLGNANGTFQSAVNYEVLNALDLRTVDLNSDGKLDLVAASYNASAASVILGNGNGTFQSATSYPLDSKSGHLAIADFNGDAKFDLALTSFPGSNTNILIGNGDGTFQAASSFPSGSGSGGILASDLNGDNKQDLLILATNSDVLQVFFGNGNGTFQSAVPYPVGQQPAPLGQGPVELQLSDLNGDGKVDVVCINATANTMSILRGNGNGTFQAAVTTAVRFGSNTPVVADFNNDGKPDLLIMDNALDVIDVRLNSPSARGATINAITGVPATNVLVGTFIDYDTSKPAASFTATINWGDGTPATSGTVSSNGSGGFNVNGTHTYAQGGVFSVNVQIADGLGNFAAANSPATVASSVIQFSQPNYSVNEGAGSVQITVVRTGDLTGTTTVDFATSDGTAKEKNDYTTSLGTLSFAAGESSKTFLVLLTDNVFVDGNRTAGLTLSHPLGASLGAQTTSVLTIQDNDSAPPSQNPLDSSQFFVRQHYHDFLNREADPDGLAFWTGNIDNCSPKPACTEVQRINTSAAFFLSIEFQQTGYLVERIYKVAYADVMRGSTFNGTHQLPVPVIRLNEFLHDTQEIGLGVVVGQGNWQQQIESNKEAFVAEFVQRSRFSTAFPASLTPAQFVDTLNSNAGNPLSIAERDQLVSQLTNNTRTRAQVLRAVAEDQDLNNAEFNRAFVLMQFFGYLRRNPNDMPDNDYTGYDFWLTKLNQFNGSFQDADMVKSFIISSEYRQRFGP
jgi:hypothetical protein